MRTPVALPPSRAGSLAVATTNDYLSAKENCKCRAELSPDEEVKKAWLNLAVSYEVLSILAGFEIAGL
jgi:hypothetical protein